MLKFIPANPKHISYISCAKSPQRLNTYSCVAHADTMDADAGGRVYDTADPQLRLDGGI